MPTLLFEIGCEELPAAACREAAEQLPRLVEEALGVPASATFVGPRRLAFLVDGLPEREPDQKRRGPAERIAFDDDGKPTKAAEGFARGAGISVEDLERRDDHVWALVPGKSTAESLPAHLAGVLRGLTFGKSMRWGPDLRFARPIRWLLAKLDGETIDLELDGVPSGGVSFGHRFGSGELRVDHANDYVELMRAANVEPDADVRRQSIVESLDVLGDWSDPGSVLDEVIYLVERPLVLGGKFDPRYLELPRRVIETAMQSHQRYFPRGEARFAFVANWGDPDTVRAGNEQVLEGRLEDAAFTFQRDVALGIDELANRLDKITFVAEVGSYAQRTERLAKLVESLGGGEEEAEAARLAKADQAAELVREFPDLEGIIGGTYARLGGYPDAVCSAIAEQYLPDAAGGPLPETGSGRMLAAADKIDTLTVAFSLGERPTGSRDPYGLRRAAIGLNRLALEGGLALDLPSLVKLDHDLLLEQGALLSDDPSDLGGFVHERLEGMLDIPVEYVRAARNSGVSELGARAQLALTLAEAAATEPFERVYVAYDRAARLAGRADGAAKEAKRALATEDAEVALLDILLRIRPDLETKVARHDFNGAIQAGAELGPPVDRFFDEVLVMAEDEDVRGNRLRLLLDVRDTLGLLGDLSQIPR